MIVPPFFFFFFGSVQRSSLLIVDFFFLDLGFSWFEYDKDGDYRIVMGDDGNIAKSVLATDAQEG